MAKQLDKDLDIQNAIKASLGDEDIDTSNFAVFEARMLSTEAITQNGFHDGARVSRSTLVEMAEYVNTAGTVVPLQTMHNTQVLPVGRVFAANVRDMPNGETELMGMFYIPQDNEMKTGLVKDIESALIEEVSVGLLAKKALCSECEFDYFGEEADFFNILTLTCDNEHTIGNNGVHVRLVGMDTFAELSLVGRGAAKDAKILSRAKNSQSLSQETRERLAASGVPAEAHFLNASFKLDSSKNEKTLEGENQMSGLETILSTTSQKLGKVEAELSQAATTIESLNGEITTLKASAEADATKIAELEAAQGEGVTELTASNEALTTQLNEATEFVIGDLKAALVASGEEEDKLPEDLTAMLSLVKEKGLKLHQLFGAEPASDPEKTDVKDKAAQKALAARKANFKIND